MCIHNVTRNRGCLGDLSFHSAKRGFEKQMKQFNCTNKGPVFEPSSRPTGGRHHSTVCSYRGHANAVHKHCGLFGDPHLRTFTDEFQTCKVQGAWPLIDNEHLTVQVTNDPVGFGDERATATSKVKYSGVPKRWGLQLYGPTLHTNQMWVIEWTNHWLTSEKGVHQFRYFLPLMRTANPIVVCSCIYAFVLK